MAKVPTVAQTKDMRRERMSNRALAILEDALDLVGKRAPAERLAQCFDDDPLAFLDWLAKYHTPAPVAEAGKQSNINNLFYLAARQAAQMPGQPALPIVDAEVVEVGVQPGYDDGQAVD